MLNDRDNKYESGQEESEYHFSDDDVSYEIESEAKPASETPAPKQNVFSRMPQSRRMIISVVVFLLLVFVVYKMVMPSTTTPATTITAEPRPVAPAQPVAPVQVSQNQPVAAPAAQPEVPQAQQQQPQAPVAPVVVVQSPGPAIPTNVTSAPVAQPVAPVADAQMPPQQGMPNVIPVQSSANYNMAQQPVVAPSTPLAANANNAAAALSNESDRLVAQFQADYAQKINEYAAQNKATQDQLQALSTRVAAMETQLTQLVQALTKPNPPAVPMSNATANINANTPPAPTSDYKLPYNVQAIIPGRAWLRSDNGETVTVAEGDMIRDLGRVTKIDPYDGVVEVNTGTKVVSLSYGNGG